MNRDKKIYELSCFKAYDIRGKLGENFDEQICYRISRAFSRVLETSRVVIGFDARESSPKLYNSIIRGLLDENNEVFELGLCGTEEMYFAVSEFNANGGIQVTASHNPKDYNGLKMVVTNSKPLSESQLQKIKHIAEREIFLAAILKGNKKNISKISRTRYVAKIIEFLDFKRLSGLKIVINAGNGVAGPTFDSIEEKIEQKTDLLKFIKINHNPDSNFPNGIPNPMLPENRGATIEAINSSKADFGIAFDGDFDRCFFFDEKGEFVSGEYIVGLISSFFLEKFPGSKIVFDPRVVWSINEVISKNRGIPILSKSGHSFFKDKMRVENAVYGGELSAHHYFRDFYFCDSGMIPWLIIVNLVSQSGAPLSSLVARQKHVFLSSGEVNIASNDANIVFHHIFNFYDKISTNTNRLDGLSMEFENWRFNLRQSNTEPLVRLNVESKSDSALLNEKVKEIISFFEG